MKYVHADMITIGYLFPSMMPHIVVDIRKLLESLEALTHFHGNSWVSLLIHTSQCTQSFLNIPLAHLKISLGHFVSDQEHQVLRPDHLLWHLWLFPI